MGASRISRKKAKFWLVILVVLSMIALVAISAFLADASERKEIQGLTIKNLDFTKLKNGVYTGEYIGTKGHFRDTTVEVTIFKGKITDIKILKGALDSEGNPAEMTRGMTIDDVFRDVIESQSLQVDGISGATLSTKTHLKALENALRKAQ
ncbi:MAG: FMN-binding domain protein [Clostridia bacterium]|jgi:uncharacterized protein with FMN-binding domain|nr:FMN-binding domain protein [Clostridia bacterium]